MWRLLKGALAHWPRAAHTAVGVALAVGLMSGTFVLTDTIEAAYARASAPAADEVDVVVRTAAAFSAAGDTSSEREPMPAALLPAVQAVPGARSAWGTVWGYAQLVGPGGRSLATDGLPAMGAAWTPDASLVAGRAPSGPGEVAVDDATAERAGLRLGDRVTVQFPAAVEDFVVTGLSGTHRLVSSTLASFELTTAQRLLGQVERLDAVSVRAAAGLSAEALRARVAAAVPEQYEVLTADQAAKAAKESWTRALGFLTTALLVLAAVGLLVGGFIIFNTFSILVAHRARELGLLRAVGASRSQVTLSVLAEALLIGVVASTAGVVAGVAGSGGLLALLRSFGLSTPTAGVAFHPRTAVVGLLAGGLLTAVAAVQPARRATRVSPLVAISGLSGDDDASLRRRLLAGTVAAAVGAGAMAAGLFVDLARPLVLVGGGAVAVLAGVALVAPVLARPVARLVGRPLVEVLGKPAVLGRENAVRNPRRTAATASALMIGIGLIGVVAILGASMKASASTTVERAMRADFVVTAHQVPGAPNGVPPVAAQRIRESPAVAAVSEIRSGQWGLRGRGQTLVAVDPATVDDLYHLDAASTAAVRSLGDDGVLVRDSVAARHRWQVGDLVPMTFARTGTRHQRLAATYSSATVRGDYVLSLGAFEANYTDQLDMEVDVRLVAGTTKAEGRAALRTALVDFPNLAVRDRAEVVAAQAEQVDRLLVPVVALLALSVVIALLGIANTLALSVHERIRELGLLRAIGMARRQLRAMIRSEAVIIAFLGAVLGVAVALFFGWVLTTALHEQGITRRVFPVGQLVGLTGVATVAGLVAATVPARRAANLRLLDAVVAD
ncbi:MAG TPA: ABC transporter permease [Acidimicrobiales bacterium]|nr:ABC transporter permease [Acidimicrobiales bacterium]